MVSMYSVYTLFNFAKFRFREIRYFYENEILNLKFRENLSNLIFDGHTCLNQKGVWNGQAPYRQLKPAQFKIYPNVNTQKLNSVSGQYIDLDTTKSSPKNNKEYRRKGSLLSCLDNPKCEY
jgi:hypothetical protein